MKIITFAKFQMTATIGEYLPVAEESYDYEGPIEKACFGGASSQEKAISSDQTNMLQTLMGNYQQQFGNQSAIYKNLTAGAGAIFAQGPGQYGFTPQENAAVRTLSDSQTASAYQNAAKTVGEQLASVGGGNVLLPSGTVAGIQANIAQQAAAQQSNQQLGITEAGYQQGLQNYNQAANVLSGVAAGENPLGYAGQATGAGQAAFGGASQIQQANQQGWQTVAGILGGAGSSFLSGFGQGLGKSQGQGSQGQGGGNSTFDLGG
jgi:hypothetical protein